MAVTALAAVAAKTARAAALYKYTHPVLALLRVFLPLLLVFNLCLDVPILK